MSIHLGELLETERAVATEACPHCGQPLLTRRAVERSSESEHELKKRLEAAVAELARRRVVDAPVDDGEREPATSVPGPLDAVEQRALRLVFRQF